MTIAVHKAKCLIRQNLFFYLTGAALVLGIKYYYSRADLNSLSWILAPTAWWVRALSGITFVKDAQAGYISHSHRFIIAASCSGVQFMTVSMATLIYSFIHRMHTLKGKFGWLALSAVSSYLLTVFVNGFRILLAIFIPIYLERRLTGMEWLTPERLHTAIGVAVYFSSLCVIYRLAEYVSRKLSGWQERSPEPVLQKQAVFSTGRTMRGLTAPAFWYFFIVLGIPLLNSAWKNDGGKFTDYALLMAAVCLTVLLICCICSAACRHISRRK